MISLVRPGARLIDAGTGAELGGDELVERVALAADELRGGTGVIFALMRPELDAIVGYLGALAAGRPIALLDPDLPADILRDQVERFAPAVVSGVRAEAATAAAQAGQTAQAGESAPAVEPPSGYALAEHVGLTAWQRIEPPAVTPDPALAVLLPTSGSTGNPKLVRLAGSAVLANAHSIAQALALTPGEVAVTSLPLFYSYGMSVLNSHLASGATVLLQQRTLLEREFWNDLNTYGVTSLAAVPYQYEMLRRLRFDPAKYPTLRTMTQAGGRLKQELVADFQQRMAAAGGRLFVMYGQTEAGPRMTTLPSDRLVEKLGSVGPAVPGGTLTVRAPDGVETTEADVTGEVVFRGPNVMMGYAETAADLARPDEQHGVLITGDLGHLDADGYLWITGRLKRMGKVFGVRVNLDDLERMVVGAPPLAVIPGDDRVIVFVESTDEQWLAKIKAQLADRLSIHSSGFEVRAISALPLMASGKIDYRALEASQ